MKIKKVRKILIGIFLFACIITLSLSFMNKTYSYGVKFKITGNAGSRVLHYYDADSGTEISVETAVEYYSMTHYYKMYDDGAWVFFYNGNETSEDAYDKGNEAELADKRARDYGTNAYRIHNISEAMSAFNDIYSNFKMGSFRLEYSPYDEIDIETLLLQFNSKYGVDSPNQNYYPYSRKGEFEPARFGLEYEILQSGEIQFVTNPYIRISGNEKQVAESFVNNILPMLQGDGSDYQKIVYSFYYITNHTSYLVDNGYADMLSSNTSIYDVFINRQSVCIGYAIAFSYLMDRFGIESYIVDDIGTVNTSTQTFASNHSYNIVKLDGKFYRVDPTGGQLLTGLSTTTLYDGTKLPISTSAYDRSGKLQSVSFDENKINSYLNSAKGMSTTTTQRTYITTTYPKTTSVGKTEKATTTKKGSNTDSNTQGETTTSIEVSTDEAGEAYVTTQVYNPETGEYETLTQKVTTTLAHTTSSQNRDINLNYILIPALIIVVILYVLYKVLTKKKTTSISSDEIQAMLYHQPNSIQSQTRNNTFDSKNNNNNQNNNIR